MGCTLGLIVLLDQSLTGLCEGDSVVQLPESAATHRKSIAPSLLISCQATGALGQTAPATRNLFGVGWGGGVVSRFTAKIRERCETA